MYILTLFLEEVEEVVRYGFMLDWLWASKLFLFFMDSFVTRQESLLNNDKYRGTLMLAILLDHFSKNLLEFDMGTSRDLLVLVFLNNMISILHQFLQCYATPYTLLFDICLILAMMITVLLMNIKI